jgi:hypothetical protein
LADQIRESGKNVKLFTGNENFQSELQNTIKELDKVIEEVAEIIQNAFKEHPKFPKIQSSNTNL